MSWSIYFGAVMGIGSAVVALVTRGPWPRYHALNAIFYLVNTTAIATYEHRLPLPLLLMSVLYMVAMTGLIFAHMRAKTS